MASNEYLLRRSMEVIQTVNPNAFTNGYEGAYNHIQKIVIERLAKLNEAVTLPEKDPRQNVEG